MNRTDELLVRAALVGIGGTVVLDLWAIFMARVTRMPATNWALVGRWFGHMPRGTFVHQAIAQAAPVQGELALGWIAHYVIGIGYGLLLLAFRGRDWLAQPTLLAPMMLVWVLLVVPFFMMMPGMGAGIAGTRTPKPNLTRLKSVMGHSVFGLGMYGTARVLACT